jgi:hypothetical protein
VACDVLHMVLDDLSITAAVVIVLASGVV